MNPRRRLQALLAIPDSERSEAQWDELNELEIMLAPGNRLDGPPHGERRAPNPQGAKPRPPGAAPAQVKKPFRKLQKKPPKPTPPAGES